MKNYKKIIYLSALILISSVSLSSFGLEKDGDYYLIGSSANLREFADKVNSGEEPKAKGKLTRDIKFNGGSVIEDGKLKEGHENFEKWNTIGTEEKPFEGEFIGNNKKITGLYIDCDEDCQGLFGYVSEEGRVRNIKVDGSYIKGKDYVGGIAGYNNGTISDSITGSGYIIKGKDSVGGNVGYNEGEIKSCKNEGEVTGGGDSVGGIVGINDLGTIESCKNEGEVTGGEDFVGGNVGKNRGAIENCENSGKVKGKDFVGGNVGCNFSGTIGGNCENSGEVKGECNVGGNVGENNSDGIIEGNCKNSGDVAGGSCIGGNIGLNCKYDKYDKETIIKEYNNSGKINGRYYVGGNVGSNEEIIKSCENSGEVKGKECIGGNVGCNKGTIESCKNSGAVTGNKIVGGNIGKYYGAAIKGCLINKQLVKGDKFVGGNIAWIYCKKAKHVDIINYLSDIHLENTGKIEGEECIEENVAFCGDIEF